MINLCKTHGREEAVREIAALVVTCTHACTWAQLEYTFPAVHLGRDVCVAKMIAGQTV